jgi:hypothetical protein
MYLRWPIAALSASCTLFTAAPAAAQSSGAHLVGPVDRAPIVSARNRPPEFRMPEGDVRRAGEPQRNGLIASVPVNENLQIGIGRFRVVGDHRVRTHTESDRNPAAITQRQRSIAGIGFSLRFGD